MARYTIRAFTWDPSQDGCVGELDDINFDNETSAFGGLKALCHIPTVCAAYLFSIEEKTERWSMELYFSIDPEEGFDVRSIKERECREVWDKSNSIEEARKLIEEYAGGLADLVHSDYADLVVKSLK